MIRQIVLSRTYQLASTLDEQNFSRDPLNEFVWRKQLLHFGKATVMDSLGVLFRYAAFMAGSRAKLGLETSRVRHYAKPSPAMLDHARGFAGTRPIAEDEF